jgi:hypothetical protein
MVKISTIFSLGIFIAVIPFTGFPFSVKNFLYIISGLLVTVLSLLIRKELEEVVKHSYTEIVKTDTFSENNPKKHTETE